MMRRPGPLRICVCTTYAADSEPRAPRHAAALAATLGKEADVTFVDAIPYGTNAQRPKVFEGLPNLAWQTHRYHARKTSLPLFAVNRLGQRMSQTLYRSFGTLLPIAFADKVAGFARVLDRLRADVYFAHTIEGLLPAAQVAHRRGAKLMFDAMEFYSDMDSMQSEAERAMIRALEAEWLPRCALVTASSDLMADELVRVYRIPRPQPLYNVPRIEPNLRPKAASFRLYWRNAVVGLGQRGLEEVLQALIRLPADVTLHIQGRLPADGGSMLRAHIADLVVDDRVVFHPPYVPENAVKEAAVHTVGLCLERKGLRNHDLTVSNKMFDYHMAGLAVISSDLPSLRDVIARSGGGLVYESGSADDLARQIMTLYRDPALRERLSANARAFALREGNWEHEMMRYVEAFRAKALPTSVESVGHLSRSRLAAQS